MSAEAPARAFLLHPKLDPWLLGGLSVACVPLLWALRIDPSLAFRNLWWLLILFSFPHFMASYAIFYGRGGLWTENQAVAVWIPLGLCAALGFAVWTEPPTVLIWLSRGTLALMFWHFLRQAYGSALWLGGVPGRPVPRDKKMLLLAALMLFGGYAYFSLQEAAIMDLTFFRFPTPPLHLTPYPRLVTMILAYGALIAFLFHEFLDWRRRKPRNFGWRGYLPVLALVTWMDPLFRASPVVVLMPIFHGVQYLPFPARVEALLARKAWRRILFWGGVVGAGYLAFEWFPRHTAQHSPPGLSDRVIAVFLIFFNVHHYLIDSVIWRFRDPRVREALGVPAKG